MLKMLIIRMEERSKEKEGGGEWQKKRANKSTQEKKGKKRE